MSSFSSPEKNIRSLGIKSTWHIADLGSGNGFYAIAAAQIAEAGIVFAVDVQKDLLERLDKHAKDLGVGNIKTIWGDIENVDGTRLRSESMDAVILANVLFQSENKQGMVDETYRILKTGGQLLIIDWSDSHGGLGPKPSHVLTSTDAKIFIKQAGYSIGEEIDAGEHHWGLICIK